MIVLTSRVFALLIEWKFDFTTIDWRVTLALLAIVTTIFLTFYFQWWRNRKRLSYQVLSDVVLISAEKEIEDKVEIRFEGHSVKNVRLLLIKLMNDGYQPIKKDEFEKPVVFAFPDAKILTAEKVEFNPENLGTQMTYRDEKLEIDPALFNRKDYIKFKVLVSGFHELKIDARIVGVSRVEKVKASSPIYSFVGFMISIQLLAFGELIVSSWTGLPVLAGTLATIFAVTYYKRKLNEG